MMLWSAMMRVWQAYVMDPIATWSFYRRYQIPYQTDASVALELIMEMRDVIDCPPTPQILADCSLSVLMTYASIGPNEAMELAKDRFLALDSPQVALRGPSARAEILSQRLHSIYRTACEHNHEEMIDWLILVTSDQPVRYYRAQGLYYIVGEVVPTIPSITIDQIPVSCITGKITQDQAEQVLQAMMHRSKSARSAYYGE
jgi:hypothetical protein